MNSDANKIRILDVSQELMLQFGYRKVSLDEIAAKLKMSKKTIYKYFNSKEDIAKALISRLKKHIQANQQRIKKENKNPLLVMSKTVLYLRQELDAWFSPFLSDIEYEIPSAWNDFVGFRTRQIMDLEGLIKSGIKKKLFRKINPSIALDVYLGAIDKIIDPENLKKRKTNFSQAINELMDIWSSGVLSSKARV